MKRIINPRFSLSMLFLLLMTGLMAQTGSDIEKMYKWTYELGAAGILNIDNYDCDLVINTWDSEKTELRLLVSAKLRNSEDAKTLDRYLNNLEFDNSPGKVVFKTRFWSSQTNIIGRKTIKLERGKNLLYKEIKVKAEIWMPRSAKLELESKYSNIELDKEEGDLSLYLYNDKLFTGNINGHLDITAKYSSFELKNCNDIVASLYDCDITTLKAGECQYTSKYSKIFSTEVQDLTIDSYTDKFTFKSSGDINMRSKYSDLKTTDAQNVTIYSYEGTFEIDNCLNMEITSKYTDFENKNVKDLLVNEIYEGSIKSDKINSLSIIKSKYVNYKLGLLDKSISLEEGYEDDFFIDELGSGFKSLDLNGKYLKCETVYNKNLNLKFMAYIKYPHLDLENVGLTTKIKIKDSTNLEFEAYKGEVTDNMPVISLTGYEISFKFK